MLRKSNLAISSVLLACLLLSGEVAQAQASQEAPYATLRRAYAALDPDAAAKAYSEGAVYGELYPGAAPLGTSGRSGLRERFRQLFEPWAASAALRQVDLNFRLVSRSKRAGESVDAGYFRLTVSRGPAAASQRAYGRFVAVSRAGKFSFDVSSEATMADFESAEGPVLFAAGDEQLEPAYFDALTGTYDDGKGCAVLVTRSAWRLFALDECTLAWRGLERVSGLRWRAGSTVLSPGGTTHYVFERSAAQGAMAIESLRIATTAGAERVLRKKPPRARAAIEFDSQGVRLHGELLFPQDVRAPRPAAVLVHGSGEQDRHGYASLMSLLAERLARAGFVVLSYDKRGVGGSGGDWTSSGFDVLGADAHAALAVLRQRKDVDPHRVGLVGSSQAGWVTAAALRNGATPDFVVLLGAAGAALSVEEQNLYNTESRMVCAGLPAADVALALDQQRAFFAARRGSGPEARARLLEATRAAARKPALRDWLFPERVDGGGPPQWYDVLDPDFAPGPVWAAYPGRSYFLFGEHDDSTPTGLAVTRLSAQTPRGARQFHTLEGAQHLGLRASSLCHGELAQAADFHPALFPTLDRWFAEIARSGVRGSSRAH